MLLLQKIQRQNAFDTIIVTTALADGTVNVAPGTYVENVAINKNLSLLSVGGRSVTTIEGISGVGSLGAVVVSNNTTGVQIGDTGKGFKIIGIDNNAPGLENAAVYFQGGHNGATMRDNEIEAKGDAGLLTEFGMTLSGFVVDGNTFSGKTFIGPNPAGDGFGAQFVLANVPRQLVAFGNGGGADTSSATNITFTNNIMSGTTGGISLTDNSGASVAAHGQGNTQVTLDVSSSTISGNTFTGDTARFATSLRARRPGTTISGNTFESDGLTATTGHVFVANSLQTLAQIASANTFDKAVFVTGSATGQISNTIFQYPSPNNNQTIIGGAGVQVAPFTGTASQYAIVTALGVTTVTDSIANRDGVDSITGVEVLQFSDGVVVPSAGANNVFAVAVDSTTISISVDGSPVASYPTNMVAPLVLDGGAGDDTFTFNLAPGAVLPAAGVSVVGGTGGNDSLVVTGAPAGNAIFNYINSNDGSVVIPGVGTINYTGLDPFSYTSLGGTLTFNLTAGADDVAVTTSGGDIILTATTMETTTVSLTGITAIIINNGGGSDKVTINNALTQNVTLNVNEVALNAAISGTVTGTSSLFTVNAGGKIQNGVDVAANSATINVTAGTYNEDVDMTAGGKTGLQLLGAGAATTTISGVLGGANETILIGQNETIDGFTITRATGVSENNIGLTISTGATGAVIRNNILTGNRTAIYLNGGNSQANITRNVIDNNRTGFLLPDGSGYGAYQITQNAITNNKTFGILFNAATAINSGFLIQNNNISGNYAVQLENNSGSSVNASGNWWGSTTPVVTASQINGTLPGVFAYPGPASPPGSPYPYDITGSSATLVDFSPYLNSGTDTDLGTPGFQGDLSFLNVTTVNTQTGATGRIQEAVNLLADGSLTGGARTVNVLAGTYDEVVNVNKSATLQGAAAHASIIAPTTGAQQKVINVDATNVTIDGFAIQVNQNDDAGIGGTAPIAPVGIASVGAAPGTVLDFNGLEIKNNQITSIGNNAVQWTGSPGFGLRAAGIVLYDSPSGGVPSVTIEDNTVDILSGTSFFQRGVWLAQLNATVTGNTIKGSANDLLFQFPSGAASLIDNNDFFGVHSDGSGGVLIADPNALAPITISNNDFTPTVLATPSTSLRVNRNAVSGSAITITGNTFNGFTVNGVDIGGAQDVSVSGNTFTPKAATAGYVHVRVDSQSASNNASTLTPINTTIDGNIFNTAAGSTGSAVVVANNLSGSNFTGVNVGSTTDNTYNAGITTGVSVTGGLVTVQDAIAGTTSGISATAGTTNVSSSTLTTNTTGISTSGTAALNLGAGNSITGGTTGLSMSGSGVTLTGNTLNNLAFSGQSGNYVTLASSALDNLEINGTTATFGGLTGGAATLAQNFAIEDKILHATDNASLGFVRVKAGEVFVTTYSGHDTNVLYGITNGGTGSGSPLANLIIEDNIIEKTLVGVFGNGSNLTPQDGSSIDGNLFRNIGVFDFGYGIALRNNFYANITNNVMDNVYTGIVTNNNSQAKGSAWTIGGNTINSFGAGLWYNQAYSTATPLTLSNNVFNKDSDAAAVTNSIGLLITGGPSFVGGSYTGNQFNNYENGVVVWGTDATTTFGSTNSISGATKRGVFVTNNVGFNPIGTTVLGLVGTPSAVVLDDLNVGVTGTGQAVVVQGDTGGGVSTLTLQNDVDLSGGTDGLAVNGPQTAIVGNTLADTDFSGQSGKYITLTNSALDNLEINGTGSEFGALLGSGATISQNYAISDKIVDAVDDASLGFVRVKAGAVFVTPNSFVSPNTTTPSVQRAIDAATTGDTVHVQAGSYTGGATASGKAITLSPGASPSQVTINGNLALGSNDTLLIEVDSPSLPSGYDNLIVIGTVDISAATLSLVVNYSPVHDDALTIIDNNLVDGVTGEFSNTSTAALTGAKSITGTQWDVNYAGGSNNDVVLSFDNNADVGANLSVAITPAFINIANRAAVPYTLTGRDLDAVLTLTFTDSLSATVVVSNVIADGTVNLSSLADGLITLTVSVTDNVGNTTTGIGDTATKDVILPAAPVVLSITDDTGLNTTNGKTSDNTLFFNGTAEPDSTVTVYSGVTPLGTTLTTGGGTWSFNYTGTVIADGTYSITATATDQANNTGPASAVFTLIVETEAPEIYAVTGPGFITEPLGTLGSSTASGVISFQDLQFEDPIVATANIAQTVTPPLPGPPIGPLGSLVAGLDLSAFDDQLGTVNWSYTVSNAAINFLTAGQQVQRTVLVTLTDPNNPGKTDQYTVTVTITGTNDTPVVNVIATNNLTEQTNLVPITATIPVTFSDVDLIDVGHTASITNVLPTGITAGLTLDNAALMALVTPGTVTKNSGSTAGSLNLGFSAGFTAFNYLATGEVLTLTYTLTINDGESLNNLGTRNFVITITGTNDAPVIDTGISANFQGAVTEDVSNPLVSTGTFPFTDVDLTDVHTVVPTIFSTTPSIGVTIPAATQTALNTALATLISNVSTGDGAGAVTWTFTLANSLTQFLAAGGTVTIIYDAKVTDDSGVVLSNSDTEQVTITITGTNDAPVLNVIAGGTVAEAVNAAAQLVVVNGTVPFLDLDVTNTITPSVTGVPTISASPAFVIPPAVAAALTNPAALSFLPTSITSGGLLNSVAYSYAPAAVNLDFMRPGDTLTITYQVKVNDGTVDSNVQNVVFTITGTNDAPVAVVDSYTTAQNTTLNATAPIGLLSNDFDFDGPPISVSAINGVPANVGVPVVLTKGTVVVQANGAMVYLPNVNVTGIETFNYTITDGSLSSSANVTIAIVGVNQLPIATTDFISGARNATVNFGVLGNDFDPDGNSFSITHVNGVAMSPTTVIVLAHGTLTFNNASAAFNFDYSPNINYVGFESFSYRITDSQGGVASASVLINVSNTNVAPVANDDSFSGNKNVSISGNVLTNPVADSDADGDILTANLATLPANGTVSLLFNGSFTYTPNVNYVGPDSFTYQVSDGRGGTDIGQVNLTVLPASTAPTVAPQTFSVAENSIAGAIVGTVLASDLDGNSLTYSLIGGSPNFAINATTGQITVMNTATLDFETTPTYNLTVNVFDGTATSAASVTINVTNVVDEVAPKVSSVRVNSTAWTTAFRNFANGPAFTGATYGYEIVTTGANLQTLTLPWVNLNQLQVQFSKNVGASLDLSDFRLTGTAGIRADLATGTIPSILSFTYDAVNFIATLTLNQSIEASKIDLEVLSAGVFDASGNRLDGEWTNDTSSFATGSGNGTAGGDFSFRMHVLPGDANRLGNEVTGTGVGEDQTLVENANNKQILFNTAELGYTIFLDVNGSAKVDPFDVTAVRNRIGSKLL